MSESSRYAILIYIDTPESVRLWTGAGDFETTADDDLDPSAIYPGVGTLGEIPALRQLIGGTAERLNFAFSGVDLIPKSWVDDDGSPITNSLISLGIVFFDAAWQIIAPVAWLWEGQIDVPTSAMSFGVKTISLSALSGPADRARPSFKFWTNAAHQKDHPGDLFFERVSIYSIGTLPKWPG